MEDKHEITIVLRILWTGGVARLAIEEARNLNSELLVLRKSQFENPYSLEGVNVRMLDLKRAGPLKVISNFVTRIFAPERGEEASVDLDLLFVASKQITGLAVYMDTLAGLTGFFRYLLKRVPYCVYLQETPYKKANFRKVRFLLWRVIDKLVLANAALVFTLTKWNQDMLSKMNIKSEVIYPGCYPANSISMNRDRVILTVSMWDSGRHPEIYVKLSQVTGLRTIIAGGWTDRSYMKEFATKNKEYVDVTGPISELQLEELYRTSYVYIRFGYEERGPGLGGLEALAHGLVVITNEELGLKELIRDYENGFVVKDVLEAAEKVKELVSDNDLHSEMSKKALESAREFTWEKHTRRLMKLVDSILE